MVGIPPVLPSDPEDVVWALQTAEALWKRDERADAIVWLRRAAQAAGEAELDERALSLSRVAADLTDMMQMQAAPSEEVMVPDGEEKIEVPQVSVKEIYDESDGGAEMAPVPAFPNDAVSNDEPPRRDSTGMQAVGMPAFLADELAAAPRPASHPPGAEAAPAGGPAEPAEAPRPAEPTGPDPHFPPPAAKPVAPEAPAAAPAAPAAAPAAAAAGGGAPPGPRKPPPLPPRARALPKPASAEAAKPTPPRPPVRSSPGIAVRPETRSVTDVIERPDFPPSDLASAPTEEVAVPPMPEPPPAEAAPQEQAEVAAPSFPAPPPPAPSSPPPEHSAAHELASVLNSIERTTHVDDQEVIARAVANEVAEAERGYVPDASETQRETFDQDSSPTPLAQEAPASMPMMPSKDLDMESIEAFADLPDDNREAMGKAADVVALHEGDEVQKFALAIVLTGNVDVAAHGGDVAARLGEGQIIYAKPTIDAPVPPLRLVSASPLAEVAFWQWPDVEKALHGCPWVEDELRTQADPVLALVGVALGPFGSRLDSTIRASVTMNLAVAAHSEGDVIATKGKQVPGLFVIGAGQVELVEGNDVKGVLGPGEFLFPAQVLGGGVCKTDARVAAGGALVLSCNRHATQELLMTCPPLLEILASL